MSAFADQAAVLQGQVTAVHGQSMTYTDRAGSSSAFTGTFEDLSRVSEKETARVIAETSEIASPHAPDEQGNGGGKITVGSFVWRIYAVTPLSGSANEILLAGRYPAEAV